MKLVSNKDAAVRYKDFVPGRKYLSQTLAGTVEIDKAGTYWWNKPCGERVLISPRREAIAFEIDEGNFSQ